MRLQAREKGEESVERENDRERWMKIGKRRGGMCVASTKQVL